MKPIFVRSLSSQEKMILEASLHAPSNCTVRRCQILVASAECQTPSQIATVLRCSMQTLRNTIPAIEKKGVACLPKGSPVPVTVQPVLNAEKRERLGTVLQQTPRNFGKPSSFWALKLLAEVCLDLGLSDTELSGRPSWMRLCDSA